MNFAPFDSSPFNSGFTGRSIRNVTAATVRALDPDSAWAVVRPVAGRTNPAAPLVRPVSPSPTAAKVTPS